MPGEKPCRLRSHPFSPRPNVSEGRFYTGFFRINNPWPAEK